MPSTLSVFTSKRVSHHTARKKRCGSVVYRSNNNANANGGVSYANANNGLTNANARIGVRLAIINTRLLQPFMEKFFRYVPTLNDEFIISECKELSHGKSKIFFGKPKDKCVVESQVGCNIHYCIAELQIIFG